MAALVLVITAPIWLTVALLVKLSTPGPALFRQERIGRGGRTFTMYKFRTMYHGADATVHQQYFLQYVQGKPAEEQGAEIFKLRRDSRITPVGGWLRQLGIDELPQLVNVLKGEMSMVGPRPPLHYEVEQYGERHRLRLAVLPGITGLWQVKGRDVVDFETMVDMDINYVERQSLRLDLVLAVLTLPTLVRAHLRSAGIGVRLIGRR